MRAVYNILANDATVAASTGGRIYLDRAPQKAASPYIVIVQDSRDPLTTSDPTKADREQIRVLTYSTTLYDDTTGAQTIALQARTALDKYNGTISTDSVYILYADESVNSLKEANKTFWEVETTFDVWLDKGEALDIDAIIERFPDPMTTTEENNVRRVIQTMYSSGNWSKYDMILALSMISPANALWNWKTPSEFLVKPGKYYEVPSSVMTLLQASSDLDITLEMKVLSTESDLFHVAQENPDTGIGTLLYVRNSDSDTDKITELTYTSLTIGDLPVLAGVTTLDEGYQALVTGEWVTVTFIGITNFTQLSTLFFNNHPSGTSFSGTFYLRNLKFATEGDQNYNIHYDGYGRSLTGHDDLITTGLQPVAVNSPTHTPGKGYESNSGYINTNYVLDTDSTNVTQNDIRSSIYIYEALNTTSGRYLYGSTQTAFSLRQDSTPNLLPYVNGGIAFGGTEWLQSRSRYDQYRDGVNSIALNKNNVQIASNTSTSAAFSDVELGLLGKINTLGGGADSLIHDTTISHFILGGGFDLTALNTELNLLESLFIQSIQDQVINIFPNALSTTEEANVRSLVTQMIASGTWFNLENLWVLSMEDATNALYCWKTGTLATAVNGPSHTANQGYLFDGSTNYINTNVTPSDDFRVASLDDVRIEAFVYENVDTTLDDARLFGVNADGNIDLHQDVSNTRLQANVFSLAGDKTKYTEQSYFEDNTRYGIGRDDATNQEIFINGVQVDSEEDNSDSLSTGDIYLGCRLSGTPSNYINGRISYLSISNAQDPTSLDTDLDTLESLFVTYVAPSYSTEAQAVIDRMPNPMSTNEKNKIATVVDQMVNNGTWAETDYFFMFAMSDDENALTDWKTGLTATAVNGPTHTAGEGYAFDGSTNYIDSEINLSTDLVQASEDDAIHGCYLYTTPTPDTNYVYGAGQRWSLKDNNGSAYLMYAAGRVAIGDVLASGNRYTVKRTGSGLETFKNGASNGTNTYAAPITEDTNLFFGCRSVSGNPNSYTDSKISHFWIGSASATNVETDLDLAETTFIS